MSARASGATPSSTPSTAPVSSGERFRARLLRLARRLPGWLQVRLSGEAPVVMDGQRLDPMLQLVRAVRRRSGETSLTAPSVEEARARLEHAMQVHAAGRTAVWSVRDLTIAGAAGPLAARHYAPPDWDGEGARDMADRSAKPLLVYFHGGGFALGSLDTHDECCRILCASGELHVLSVAYRLAPEHPFPAAVDDAQAAHRWARANAESLGADADRVAVGGDEAGGNLAAVVARLERDAGAPPAAQLLIYPLVDAGPEHPSRALFGEGEFFLDARDRAAFAAWYAGGADPSDPRRSPLRAPSLENLPAALVVTAGFDMLRDEGRAYSTALLDAHNRVMTLHYPALAHGFVNLTGVSHAAYDATVHVAAGFRMLIEGARSSGPRPANL